MRIVVLSDTHTRALAEIPSPIRQALTQVDLIIHAGDFTEITVLEELRTFAEVKAVCGNMDSPELKRTLPPKAQFVVSGKKVGLIHGWGAPWGIAEKIREVFTDEDIIVYGHSHQAFNQHLRGSLMFNPGCAWDSYGILTIDDTIKTEIVRI